MDGSIYFLCKIINQIPDQENNNNLKTWSGIKNYIEKFFKYKNAFIKKNFNSNIICRSIITIYSCPSWQKPLELSNPEFYNNLSGI